jgi:hypothetical protein
MNTMEEMETSPPNSPSECDSDEEDFRCAVGVENTWFIENYEALAELYHQFKENGEHMFGNWFYQSGGFHHFVKFVYTHSQLSSKPP